MAAILFTGGRLFDGHRHRGAGDLLVRDGRVVAVGRVEPGQAAAADVVDVAGGLVAPGFVDAHVHVVQGGLERIRCDLSATGSREQCLEVVAAYAAAHPDRSWIVGGGWSMAAFPGGAPEAADLDRIVADRPVFLPNRDHHGAWVNSRALDLAGIDRDTPDPPDGRIERAADGRPTGTLHEGAMALVARLLPPSREAEYDEALRAGQAYLHSLGVTGWQDALVGDYAGIADPGPAYLRAAGRGTLTGDVVGALWWDRDRGLEQVPELVARREAERADRFRATSVKVMLDGVAENFTAAVSTPYLDRCGHATGNRGHAFLEPDRLEAAVRAVAAEGFQVHVHAIGDRAVRSALDAFAAVPPDAPGDLRHQIAHLQLVHPADVPRFARHGVAANLQALWACLDDQMTGLTLPFLGEERARWQYPFGDLHRAGARLAMGSDWPVSSPDPMAALHTAVTRTAYGDPGRAGREPFLPDQALDLATAFAAYTSGSARANHRDDAGVLAPGAVADVVVLDRDPFAGDVAEIGATRVRSTWVAGSLVFEAPGA